MSSPTLDRPTDSETALVSGTAATTEAAASVETSPPKTKSLFGNSSFSSDIPQVDEFTYRPMPILAPTTFVFGIVSTSALMLVAGLIPAILGVLLGPIVLWQIRRSDGMLSGGRLAGIGTALSALMLIGGTSYHAYTYATEVPEGYERISFSQDISRKGFLTVNGAMGYHPDVAELNGKEVFIKGFMYPEKQTHDLRSFLLVKDNGDCCFGGQPKLTDMIHVRMAEGTDADFYPTKVAITGTFRLADAQENWDGPTKRPVYVLDNATNFGLSKTSF